jgi:hypothetical protein
MALTPQPGGEGRRGAQPQTRARQCSEPLHWLSRLHTVPAPPGDWLAPAPTPSHHWFPVQRPSPVLSFVPQPQAAAADTQMKLPGQLITEAPPVQYPLLHVVGVDTWVEGLPGTQLGVPVQPPPGYWQLPLPSQPVAPQVPPVAQVVAQQLPLPPVVPHVLLAQSVAWLHPWPLASRQSFPPTQV